MLVLRLFGKLLKAVCHLIYIVLLFVFATTWVAMKFLARNAYEILFVLLLLRILIFIALVFVVLFGLKK